MLGGFVYIRWYYISCTTVVLEHFADSDFFYDVITVLVSVDEWQGYLCTVCVNWVTQ